MTDGFAERCGHIIPIDNIYIFQVFAHWRLRLRKVDCRCDFCLPIIFKL